MNATSIHLSRQRLVLRNIAADLGEIETMALGAAMNMGSKQAIFERINAIRQTVRAVVNDTDVGMRVLAGYRQDCLDSLGGFEARVREVVNGLDESGEIEPADRQLQELAMAARSFAERTEQYMAMKAEITGEVGHD